MSEKEKNTKSQTDRIPGGKSTNVFLIGLASFLLGCLAMLALPYLLDFYNYAIVVIGVLAVLVFVVFIFKGHIERFFMSLVNNFFDRSLLPVLSKVEGVVASYGKSTDWVEEGRNLLETAVERYMAMQFRKWLFTLMVGCLTLMVGLFSFHALNEQNRLLAVEMKESNNVSKAQLKMKLKEEYVHWRDKVPLLTEESGYQELIDSVPVYKEYLNQYWSIVIRQEYEVLVGNGRSGDMLTDLFMKDYSENHKLALQAYPALDTARIEYLKKRIDRIDTISGKQSFYTYLYELKPCKLE